MIRCAWVFVDISTFLVIHKRAPRFTVFLLLHLFFHFYFFSLSTLSINVMLFWYFHLENVGMLRIHAHSHVHEQTHAHHCLSLFFINDSEFHLHGIERKKWNQKKCVCRLCKWRCSSSYERRFFERLSNRFSIINKTCFLKAKRYYILFFVSFLFILYECFSFVSDNQQNIVHYV